MIFLIFLVDYCQVLLFTSYVLLNLLHNISIQSFFANMDLYPFIICDHLQEKGPRATKSLVMGFNGTCWKLWLSCVFLLIIRGSIPRAWPASLEV